MLPAGRRLPPGPEATHSREAGIRRRPAAAREPGTSAAPEERPEHAARCVRERTNCRVTMCWKAARDEAALPDCLFATACGRGRSILAVERACVRARRPAPRRRDRLRFC